VEKGEKLLEIPGHIKIEVKEESTFVYFIISLYTSVCCLSIFYSDCEDRDDSWIEFATYGYTKAAAAAASTQV
jgi:hypothetical protein